MDRARTLKEMLGRAEVLVEAEGYPPYDPARADRVITRAIARSLCRAARRSEDGPGTWQEQESAGTAALPHERAGRELRTLCLLVTGDPRAPEWMASLVGDASMLAEGALVFACVLKLTGWSEEGAQLWWQLAAGMDNHTAAYCLHLHHLARGELRDARHWHRQSAALTPRRGAVEPGLPGGAVDFHHPELIAAHADLIAEAVGSPDTAALAAAVSALQVSEDPDDFGTIPLPDPKLLADELAAAH